MSIEFEIQRLREAKASLKAAIEAKGGEIGLRRIDEFAEVLAALPSGGDSAGGVKCIADEAAMLSAMEVDPCGTLYQYEGGDSAHLVAGSLYLLIEAPSPLTEGIALRTEHRALCSLTPGIFYPGTTHYTAAEIAACDYIDESGRLLHLYGWGATEDSFVVGAFSEDYSLLTLTRNGDDSDGIMKQIPLHGDLHTLIEDHVVRILTGHGLSGAMTYLGYGLNIHTVQIAPNSFTALGDYSLCCNRFSELIVPEGVRTLGRAALQSCPNLTHLSLPSTFTGFTDTQTLSFDSKLTCITYRGLAASLQALIDPNTWYCANMGTNVIHCLDGDVTVEGWRVYVPASAASGEVSA